MAGMEHNKEAAMPTVLITGIEPFDGETLNPSWEAARRLDGQTVAGARLAARQLPCVIGKVVGVLRQAIEDIRPDLVICLGQAGGRSDLSVERVAINVVDARIPDNEGRQPIDEPVVEGGPAAYFSTLPIKAIVRDLRAGGVPASVSLTAGTYNCNTIFYGLAHCIATERPGLRGGFVHVPYLPEMAARHPGQPSLALDVLVHGVKIIVATSLAVTQDVKLGGGALH
ncbi:Pyrrolidone-carboxylate peptidase [compost metagenome]